MARDDHWFKFYYHRILVSCAGWKDDEFGAFVKLLIHQFDKGFVPADESELKRIITSFKKNWPLLKKKFKLGEDGNLYNHVMEGVREERLSKKEKFTEFGKLGGRPKQKKETLTKPEGYEKKTYIYSNSYSNSDFEDKGVGKETFEPVGIVPEMVQRFKNFNPAYPVDSETDFAACLEISRKILKSIPLTGDVTDFSNREKILFRWGELVVHIRADSHLSKYSLSQINKHFQSVIQSFTNGTTSQRNPAHRAGDAKPAVRKSAGANQLLDELEREIASDGGQ